ncbi:MAG: hypothetical protein Q7K25_06290 [Actinomycetota bacterium]|nr:hypothetical protein [Actinomycetota bacterium]
MTEDLMQMAEWASNSCSLPTAERHLRIEEFNAFFKDDVAGVSKRPQGEVHLTLRPGDAVAQRAAQLAVRESTCCSFFTFHLIIGNATSEMFVSADAQHSSVLDDLAQHATVQSGSNQ